MKPYKIKGFCSAINSILPTLVQYFPVANIELWCQLIKLSTPCLTNVYTSIDNTNQRKYAQKQLNKTPKKSHSHFMEMLMLQLENVPEYEQKD